MHVSVVSSHLPSRSPLWEGPVGYPVFTCLIIKRKFSIHGSGRPGFCDLGDTKYRNSVYGCSSPATPALSTTPSTPRTENRLQVVQNQLTTVCTRPEEGCAVSETVTPFLSPMIRGPKEKSLTQAGTLPSHTPIWDAQKSRACPTEFFLCAAQQNVWKRGLKETSRARHRTRAQLPRGRGPQRYVGVYQTLPSHCLTACRRKKSRPSSARRSELACVYYVLKHRCGSRSRSTSRRSAGSRRYAGRQV